MNVELSQQLREIVQSKLYGVATETLVKLFAHSSSRRTIQRHLDGLVKAGAILRTGAGRGTCYQPILPRAVVYKPGPETEMDEFGYASMLRETGPEIRPTEVKPTPQPGLVLSGSALKLRDYVRQNLASRKRVGYERAFLERYQPNKTYYLSTKVREHLHTVAQSEQMAAMPPGTYAAKVLDRLLIDLSWNSSRLEGNTFSLLETDRLIAQGMTENTERFQEAQMILNHKAAIEFIVEEPKELGFNRYTFLNLHAMLAESLLKNRAAEGALRQTAVLIHGSAFRPCNQPSVIEECFDLLLSKAAKIKDPIECSFFLMVHLPYLQPFDDCNKRTSRLGANLPLIQNNMAPLSFVDVPVRDYVDGVLAVYEMQSVELLAEVFAWAYERSAGRYALIKQEVGEPDPIEVRYRVEIKELVRDVVVKRLTKLQAAQHVRQWSLKQITATDRARFMAAVEERLLALREGSSARYRIRPSEFSVWWSSWS